MPNIFDTLEASLHKTTTRTFGYTATWLPSVLAEVPGAVPYTKVVHLKDPNKYGDRKELEKIDFAAKNPVMEYFEGDFPGLEFAANDGGDERVTIDRAGILTVYSVLNVNAIHDGFTYLAVLVPIAQLI